MSVLRRIKARRAAEKAASPSIPVFAVYRVSDGRPSGDPIYYACTSSEAIAHISRLIQIRRSAHYSEWCRLHGKKPGFPSDSWDEYVTSVMPDGPSEDEAFAVAKALLSAKDMASLMRMLSISQPGFTQSEADEELIAYLSSAGERGMEIAKKACEADPGIADRIDSIMQRLPKRDNE